MDGTYLVPGTDRADRLADIVFVHGLGGGSHSTWTHGEPGQPNYFFWPEELAKELPQCGVWTVHNIVYLGVLRFIQECLNGPAPPSLPRPVLQALWQYLETVLPRNP